MLFRSWTLGVLTLVLLGPINLLVWHRPSDLGLLPDGDTAGGAATQRRRLTVVDPDWAAIDWTLARAMRSAPFWWLCLGFFGSLFAWYAVQVHQTKYLIEVGFPPMVAAWGLGIVSAVAIPGQIGLGALSDRIGREWIWTVGCLGFAISYATLVALEAGPSTPLLWVMVISQGSLGYALTSVMGPIVMEIFEGRSFGAIFGTLTVPSIAGGATGPWVAGLIHDIPTVKQLVDRIMSEADAIIAKRLEGFRAA